MSAEASGRSSTMSGRNLGALAVSTAFLFIGPGIVDGLIPWWITRWHGTASLPLRLSGGALIAAGCGVLVESFLRFPLEGAGTPAPPFPTRRLVVHGFYRYTRNPMYVANLAIIGGQALWFGSWPLAAYAAAAGLGFHAFVRAYEEPKLHATYGAEYERFRENVPRWIPRRRPWEAPL
jgi:protein-S-isoprenylcysteine O-methyltransferase Ste14